MLGQTESSLAPPGGPGRAAAVEVAAQVREVDGGGPGRGSVEAQVAGGGGLSRLLDGGEGREGLGGGGQGRGGRRGRHVGLIGADGGEGRGGGGGGVAHGGRCEVRAGGG